MFRVVPVQKLVYGINNSYVLLTNRLTYLLLNRLLRCSASTHYCQQLMRSALNNTDNYLHYLTCATQTYICDTIRTPNINHFKTSTSINHKHLHLLSHTHCGYCVISFASGTRHSCGVSATRDQ